MLEESRRTILVVDDSPEDIAILNEELKRDYRVLAATDHDAAIKIAHNSTRPDLILLDVMMPGMNGYELCRALKADPTTSGIPVIFVTVQGAADAEAEGFEAGCVDYIVKPVNPFLVKARARTHIDLKVAREDLERQNEILRENARLHEEVQAISRHDLKNPLMVILTASQALGSDTKLAESQRTLARLSEDAGHRMLEMINRTIDMFKMEKGAYEVSPVVVDVLKSIRQVVLAFQAQMEAKGIVCESTLWGSVPAAEGTFTVMGEELLIYSMLGNLIKNAVEASPPGGRITIRLDVRELAEISIHNMGAIPTAIRPRFFEKFATSGKAGGTGLGAYSARLMARTLGGSLRFETSEEAGTTITVALPRAEGNPGLRAS